MASKIWVRAIVAAAVVSLSMPVAVIGQGTGAPTTSPTTGNGGTGTGSTGGTAGRTTTSPTSTTTSPTTTPQPSSVPQPIFISGRVMLEEGTPPPESAVIETSCNGRNHSEGYTDSKGYFALELGARNGLIQDASELSSFHTTSATNMTGGNSGSGSPGSSQAAERKYMGCDLQAKLAGFRSQTVALTGRRAMDNPDVGTILLHRNGPAEEGQTISAVSLAAPKDAKKAYDKGLEAIRKKKFDDARTSFEKAVEAYPRYATAWYELGLLQAGQGKPDMARSYFDKALECDPKYVQSYLQISILELQASRWRSLADVTDRLLKLDPFDYPQAFFFNSLANFNLQRFDAAEKSALAAERLDTRHAIPKVSHLLGLLLAIKRDYPGAAEHFKTYLKFAPDADDAAKVRTQLAEVERITAARAAGK